MKTPALLLAGLLAGVPISAQEILRTFPWETLTGTNAVPGGTPVTLDGRAALRLVNTNPTPLWVPLLRIDQPGTELRAYAVRGEVRYEGVEGVGFLEMWSQFPSLREDDPPGRYFSRTLGLSGPMGRLSGTCGWRDFELPFDPTGASGSPTRLELNLHLPGRGVVILGPVTLVRYSGTSLSPSGGTVPGEWWSNRMAGTVGGLGGGVIGCLAGLAGFLAGRGRAPGFVVGLMNSLTVLGGLSLAGGLAALAVRQPVHVWGTLLLLGLILVTTIPFRLRQMRRHYADLELRRMTAVDAV